MRRKYVAGNWKMNGDLAALAELEAIAAALDPRIDVAVAVPATLIHAAAARARFPVGAQDVHPADSGAHTGCLSAPMIAQAGAAFAIVGHSERRQGQHETDADVKAKAEALHRHRLDAIVCVGETLDQREAGQAEAIVTAQVLASLPDGAAGDWLAIAYEPIWAIGTGKTATPAQAQEACSFVRALVADIDAAAGAAVRVLYGGSAKPENIVELMALPDVDGALVGGASLDPESFATMVEAAAASTGG